METLVFGILSAIPMIMASIYLGLKKIKHLKMCCCECDQAMSPRYATSNEVGSVATSPTQPLPDDSLMNDTL